MDEKELISLRGALTAQGYLVELLFGAQMLATADPQGNLARARTQLDRLMRSDMSVPPTDTPHAQFLPIQGAALTHLHEMLDRVQTQLAARSPK